MSSSLYWSSKIFILISFYFTARAIFSFRVVIMLRLIFMDYSLFLHLSAYSKWDLLNSEKLFYSFFLAASFNCNSCINYPFLFYNSLFLSCKKLFEFENELQSRSTKLSTFDLSNIGSYWLSLRFLSVTILDYPNRLICRLSLSIMVD